MNLTVEPLSRTQADSAGALPPLLPPLGPLAPPSGASPTSPGFSPQTGRAQSLGRLAQVAAAADPAARGQASEGATLALAIDGEGGEMTLATADARGQRRGKGIDHLDGTAPSSFTSGVVP
jgi:hypothetical protein